MPIIDILFDSKTLFAMLVFILLAIVTEIIGRKISLLLENVPVSEWIFERVFIPLARAIGLMVFILLCYPVIFGLTEAPPLSELLSTGSHRISTLMNVLFILPLLFSLVPLIGKVPGFVLPIQGIAGATLVFSWMQGALSAGEIHYVPQAYVLLIIILMAIFTHVAARRISAAMSDHINKQFNINDGQKIVYRIVIVAVQLPVVLIYTRGLGAQL